MKENMIKVIRELKSGKLATSKLYCDYYDGFRKAVTITNRTICSNVGRVFQNCRHWQSKKITIKSKTGRRRYYSLNNDSTVHRCCTYPMYLSFKGLAYEVCVCPTIRNIKKTGTQLSSFNKRNQGGYLK